MKRKRSIFAVVGALLLAQLKWVIALLKWSKFGGTLLSMAISLAAYALIYGWKFAAALVYLIFVHETGHLIAARNKGIRTSPAIFVPFVGAFISVRERPRDAATEAYLAYGGPLAGFLSFLPAVPLYTFTGDPVWGLVIYLGATLNLFNLLPVSPLDGGRIAAVLSPNVWLAGLLLMAAMVWLSPSPLLILIFLLGLFAWWNRVREGYQRRILSFERDQLEQWIDELNTWPSLSSTEEYRRRLLDAVERLEPAAKRKRVYLPFLQDRQRLERDQARLLYQLARLKRDLFLQWERMPVVFLDGNPLLPEPSPLLADAAARAQHRLREVEEQLHRLSTYYQASPATKWKVLAAYVTLALALTFFWYYGNGIMRQHHGAF